MSPRLREVRRFDDEPAPMVAKIAAGLTILATVSWLVFLLWAAVELVLWITSK